MTKQEAEAFLERNPKIALYLVKPWPEDLSTPESLDLSYLASNEDDAKANCMEVVRALGQSGNADKT